MFYKNKSSNWWCTFTLTSFVFIDHNCPVKKKKDHNCTDVTLSSFIKYCLFGNVTYVICLWRFWQKLTLFVLSLRTLPNFIWCNGWKSIKLMFLEIHFYQSTNYLHVLRIYQNIFVCFLSSGYIPKTPYWILFL
jgi:hypothetical protein